MMLRKIALARGPLEWAPGAPIGMLIGAQVPPPQPAAVIAAGMGTAMPRSVHCAGAAMGWGQRRGWHRRRHVRRGRFSLTQGALRSLGQVRKRYGVFGALASEWLG